LRWRCPVCRTLLALSQDGGSWACPAGHSFDVARAGYVNLLVAGQRRSRQPGDSEEMVRARHRFLATGAYDPLSHAVADAVRRERPSVVLDVGCGEGRHTRHVEAPDVLGIDVAKPAVAIAARAHPLGRYAVASAADVPLQDAVVDLVVSVFAPVVPEELARVVRAGGTVLAVHPGPDHLENLRSLVYDDARPHEVKPPLRGAEDLFTLAASESIRFPVVVAGAASLEDLFAMTPYRWHAPTDMRERLAAASAPRFETVADMRISTYRRSSRPLVESRED
jgi:23S rRNA (guanine745-N1)-methyltransferase